ncbi:SGS-domain-containing protein [Meredithblackwellia eburnea MCA 4105]
MAGERPKVRHEWYQSDSDVVLSLFIRNVDKDTLNVEYEQNAVTISYPLQTGSQFSWSLDSLAHEIDTKNSSVRVLAPKIEITLKKKQPGVRWAKLEAEEGADAHVDTMAQPSGTGRSYPTSSKVKTNWDALAKSAVEEEEKGKEAMSKDPNGGGDKQLNELFQKLYEGATDEQRMAMVKSYQESNGTALSTDWNDVKKGKVETRPPDSMIAKKWGA